MTNYKEILRLNNLRINNSQIAAALGCSRTTVIAVLQKMAEKGVTWQKSTGPNNTELARILFPDGDGKPVFKMPDYEYIRRELAKSGMTLDNIDFENNRLHFIQQKTDDPWEGELFPEIKNALQHYINNVRPNTVAFSNISVQVENTQLQGHI